MFDRHQRFELNGGGGLRDEGISGSEQAPTATSDELTVDYQGRETANAKLHCSGGSRFLMHIVDLDFVISADNLPNRIDRFFADPASGAEDLYFVSQDCTSSYRPSGVGRPRTRMQAGQWAFSARRGHTFQIEAVANSATPP